MADTHDTMLATLRGTLPPASVGARGLEKLARNPRCARLRALTVARVNPAHIAARLLPGSQVAGQSPFSIQLGLLFERHLLERDAARLVQRYQADGMLPASAACVMSAPLDAANEERLVWTRRLLSQQRGRSAEPALLIHPLLSLTALERGHLLELDALRWDGERLIPVEIKSYAARGTLTDPADLRSAARQCAIYVLALRETLRELGAGHGEREAIAPATADLILRAPGSLTPVRLPITLAAEVAGIERHLENPAGLTELLATLPAGATLDDPATLAALPHAYRDSCRDHCALAAHCKAQALRGGDLSVLGDGAASTFAPAGSIGRVLALLHGAPPQADGEATLQAELLRVLGELEAGGMPCLTR